MQERTKLDGLTAARFYAALMIVVFHVAAMPQLPLPDYLHFIRANFGLGVQFFFVISAFSLFVGYFGKMEGKPQVRDYAVRRFFRIAPLFYFMMAVYVAYRFLQYGVETGLGHILTSATFTFNFFPQYVEGFVWASWTIGIEMAFYGVVPFLIGWITTLRRSLILFLFAVGLGVLWTRMLSGLDPSLRPFSYYFFLAHLVYFAGGIVGYFVWLRIKHRTVWGAPVTIGGVMSVAVLLLFRDDAMELVPWDWIPPAQTIPLIIIVVGLAMWPSPVLVNRVTKKLGEASFSLYLFHPLIIGILMVNGFFKWVNDSVGDDAIAYGVSLSVTLALLFPTALLGYRYIEVPGNRAGAYVITLLRVPRPKAG